MSEADVVVSPALADVADDPKAVFIATMARELHRAGVATDALEQTLGAIAQSIDLPIQIFALPTYVTLAIGPQYRQRVVMLRMDPGYVNLGRITLLNDIYDDLRRGRIDFPEASRRLEHVGQRWPTFSPWLKVPSLAFVALGVAVLLGGGWREIFVAVAIGAITGTLAALGTRSAVTQRLHEVIAAFAGTLIYASIAHFVGPTNVYISIVAGVVVLLPGYSLTLALHELANQNLVAGVSRLGKVLSTLLALGCGALLGFTILGPSLLASGRIQPHPVGLAVWVVALPLMTIGLWLDLNARLRDFGWVFASAFVAVAASYAFALMPARDAAPFASAFLCGIVANLGARYLRVPQPVMLVPALFVLVPGSLSYQSVLLAFGQNITSAIPLAATAVIKAILLVAGLLLSQIVFPSAPLRIPTRPSPPA